MGSMDNGRVSICPQDTRRARADMSQGEGLATASADDDEDNQDDSEGQRDERRDETIAHLTLTPARTHARSRTLHVVFVGPP